MHKFDKLYNIILENLSTDVLGCSEPTAGIFSGDNFAAGDMRVLSPIGMFSRGGKISGKNKKRGKKRKSKKSYRKY